MTTTASRGLAPVRAVADNGAVLIAKTRLGMRIRAGETDREMIAALGIDIRTLYTVVFALGAALAGLAGAMVGALQSVQVGMGEPVLILAFVVIVIGGIGSIKGAMVAALLIGIADTLGKVLFPEYSGMAVYVLMAAVLILRPRGLFQAT